MIIAFLLKHNYYICSDTCSCLSFPIDFVISSTLRLVFHLGEALDKIGIIVNRCREQKQHELMSGWCRPTDMVASFRARRLFRALRDRKLRPRAPLYPRDSAQLCYGVRDQWGDAMRIFIAAICFMPISFCKRKITCNFIKKQRFFI